MTHKSLNPNDRDTFSPGTKIGNYEIVFLVGLGGFGDVYKVKDRKTSQMFALKTESVKAPQKLIDIEIDCLKNIKGDCFPRLRDSGTEKKVNYLVMNLCGASVSSARQQHSGKLPLKATLPIGLKMLEIIESFHDQGYVHRDIKPSNFLLQPKPTAPLVLIDFGLCRRHIDPETNEPYEARENIKLTGTRKYCSPHGHEGCDLGRRDDLYSWFYGVAEIANGELPWGKIQNAEEVFNLKANIDIENFVKVLPREFVEIYQYLETLEYKDKPDYDKIKNLVRSSMTNNNIDPDNFEWNSFYAAHSNLGDLSKAMKNSNANNEPHSAPAPEAGEGGCCNVY